MNDRELGMRRRIPRRDFLDGMAVTIGAALTGCAPASEPPAVVKNPPAETGIVGQTNAAYATAHRLRDGTFWKSAPQPVENADRYDLIVAGAGISGLSAAYFYRKRFPGARVLVLDNLDDFGGHAKRNEFRLRGRLLLANGGTQSLEQPSEYSAVAKGLLHALGVEPKRFYRYYDAAVYKGLGNGVFFDAPTFGTQRFVRGFGQRSWPEFFAAAPFAPEVRASLTRLFTERVDYLPGRSVESKRALLAHTSYAKFLVEIAYLDRRALPFFQTWTNDFFGVGIDAVPALDIYESGDDYGMYVYPGFRGMDLGDGAGYWTKPRGEPYIFHFPDGNASIARLLVRALVPGALGGHTMEDIVTETCDYGTLDRPGNSVQIRLESTVARVQHRGDPRTAGEVVVDYVRGGKLERVRARHCVLACFNTMVPYIAPELPRSQREALAYGVKVPLVYARVVIGNWGPFHKLGVHQFIAPGSFFPYVGLDFPVSIGEYKFPSDPSEPMALFLLRTPCSPGHPEREQHRLGRAELYGMPFATFERNTRTLLGNALGSAGFDPSRDILAIDVNRWAHGYAYEYNSLYDPEWPPGQSPAELGRRTFHRIAIANSDAGASAYTDGAIDQAHRAVASFS